MEKHDGSTFVSDTEITKCSISAHIDKNYILVIAPINLIKSGQINTSVHYYA